MRIPGFYSGNFFIIMSACMQACYMLNISVLLSHDIAKHFYGQLIGYYTFTDGGEASLSFELLDELDSSGRLYLFAVGMQRTLSDMSENSCLHFYRTAISNVSLNSRRGVLRIGSFTGNFPTFLVFSSDQVCKHGEFSGPIESIAHLVLSNPNGQPLSGSLIGLPEHYIGLICVYTFAIFYTCRCIRLAACCSHSRRYMLADNALLDFESSSLHSLPATSNFRSACCSTRHLRSVWATFLPSRGFFGLTDNHEKRLALVCLLLCVNLSSLAFALMELRSLARSTIHLERLSQPWFGANSLYSYLAEVLAIVNNFVYATLLVFLTTEIVLTSARAKPPHSAVIENECELQTCCSDSTQRPSHRIFPVPAFSAFRFSSLFMLRVLWSLALIQVVWYLATIRLFTRSSYATPDRWPIEEQHSYWAGLGMPVTLYSLPSGDISNVPIESNRLRKTINQLHESSRTFLGSVSPIAATLTMIRTGLGVILSVYLLRTASARRPDCIGELYARCGLLGCLWFLAHPVSVMIGVIFADYIRYKVTVIAVTLTQAVVCGSMLYLFARQSVLWDVSALSDSLPVLKRSSSSHSKT